jgi:fumarate hydratase class II
MVARMSFTGYYYRVRHFWHLFESMKSTADFWTCRGHAEPLAVTLIRFAKDLAPALLRPTSGLGEICAAAGAARLILMQQVNPG